MCVYIYVDTCIYGCMGYNQGGGAGEKMTAKAEADEALEKHTDEKASSTEELMGNGE